MRRKQLIGIGLFLIVILGWAVLYRPNSHPSDSALIDYFQKHQADFDRLVNMANEDSAVQAIYSDHVMLKNNKVWPKNTAEGFTRERWSEYQNLFVNLKEYRIDGFFKAENIIRITVSVDVSDLNDSNEAIVITKGYAYSSQEPPTLVESLDSVGFDNGGTYYKKIGGNWYLYREWGVSKPE